MLLIAICCGASLVPISDASAAALLERRFPALERARADGRRRGIAPERAATYHPELVHETQQAAVQAVAGVRPGELFNRGPLVRAVGAAVVLVAVDRAVCLVSREAFGFWLERIALSDEPWPRRVQLEVVGFPADAAGRRVHKLAQDDDFELLVHARTDGYEVPDEVEIRFRLADGRRGRDTMIRVGEAHGQAATSFRCSATSSSAWPATWSSTSWAATTACAICGCRSSSGRSCSRSSWNAFIRIIWRASRAGCR